MSTALLIVAVILVGIAGSLVCTIIAIWINGLRETREEREFRDDEEAEYLRKYAQTRRASLREEI